MRTWRRLFPCVLLGLLGLLGAGSVASARAREPEALHPRWQLIATHAGVVANGSYLAMGKGLLPNAYRLILVNRRTGRHTLLHPPGCPLGSALFGGPWLAVDCGTGETRLYDLRTRRWTQPKPLAPQYCYYCQAVAVGSRWIKFNQPCRPDCPRTFVLENIRTGAVKPDTITPGGTTYDDLDASTAESRLCPPLHYPATYDSPFNVGLGDLTFYGPFVVTFSIPFGSADPNTTILWRLQRCYSNLNLPIRPRLVPEPDSAVKADPQTVVWATGPHDLAGLFLPSLRQFTLSVRKPIASPYGSEFVISQRTLYITADDGKLWAAQLR